MSRKVKELRMNDVFYNLSTQKCKGCKVYRELRSIRKELEQISRMRRLLGEDLKENVQQGKEESC